MKFSEFILAKYPVEIFKDQTNDNIKSMLKKLACIPNLSSKDKKKFTKINTIIKTIFSDNTAYTSMLEDIDTYVSLIKHKEYYIPLFKWNLRKKIREKYNKLFFVYSDFELSLNSRFYDTNNPPEDYKVYALNKLKSNKEKLLEESNNLEFQCYWNIIKKDESRQGGCEDEIVYVHTLLGIPGVLEKLSLKGINAYYNVNNTIITNQEKKPPGSESIDLRLILNNQEFFIQHKFQNSNGGGQGQISNKVINSLNQGESSIVYIGEGEGSNHENISLNPYFNSFDKFYLSIL